jgi:hypothetical protein
MADLMEGPARTRLVALVVLLAVSVPLTIVAVVGSGGGGDEGEGTAGLRVERSPDLPEMIVFLTPEVNTLERTGGRTSVTVECLDTGGRVLSRQDEAWPFTDTDRQTLDPHAHIRVNPARINDVAGCRVRPTDPPLEGPVS